jgi:thiol-disulfide isomerase/thioredoxin
MLAACVGLAPLGCTSTQKRGGNAAASADKGAPARAAADTGDPLVRHATAQDQYGMLAGRVLDLGTGKLIDAYVRWECVDEPKAPSGDVAATGGLFTIQGCKPGKQYKLTARTKQGGTMLAGVSYVTAPSVVVLIKLSENFVTPATPPLPGPPVPGDKSADAQGGLKKTGATERPGWEPGVGAVAVPGIQDVRPYVRPMQPQQGWDQPRPPSQGGFVPGIARGEDGRPKDAPVRINPGAPDPSPNAPPAPSGAVPMGAALPPSCNLMGNQVGGRLYNLALRDLEGNPWEWRTHRRGRLVLLDFWKHDCMPCRYAIEDLKKLQAEYGYAGLEVIGIACEERGSAQEQVYRAATVCQSAQTNYRLLLAGGTHNPVPEQFGVRAFPTLFLLDENGIILWVHEGGFRPDDRAWIRRQIEQRLGVRKQ